MEKVEIYFDEKKYNDDVKALNNIADAMSEALRLSLLITENEIKEISTIPVIKWVTDKTGFKNAIASAELLNVGKELQTMMQLETIYINSEVGFFELIDNEYKPTKKAVERIKNECTSYLNDEYIEQYLQLKKIEELLNDLPTNSIRYLQLTPDRTIKINLNLLQNQKFI